MGNMVRGTRQGREGSQTIMWCGSEDLIRCWDYDYFVVRDSRKTYGDPLAMEMTKREAWEFYKAHPLKQHLIIENWFGGGNSEASDDQCYQVWPKVEETCLQTGE